MEGSCATLPDITRYFEFWRQAKTECIEDDDIRRLFVALRERFEEYKSIPLEVFSESLSSFFAGQGVDYSLNNTQEKNIIDKLAATAVQGKLNEEVFVACFKYWTRKKTVPVKAFLIIDVQNDFIRGSLRLDQCPAKEDGEEVVPVINKLIERGLFDVLAYSYDWHPADHCSFHSNVKKHATDGSVELDELKVFDKVTLNKPVVIEQVLWPDHCVQNGWGAKLHKDLRKPDFSKDIVVYKGQFSDVDSYSAFWDNGKLRQTDLFLNLLKKGVSDVYISGLAFDICVAYTAEAAAVLGFNTFVIEDACRSVDLQSKAATRKKFDGLGIKLLQTSDIISE